MRIETAQKIAVLNAQTGKKKKKTSKRHENSKTDFTQKQTSKLISEPQSSKKHAIIKRAIRSMKVSPHVTGLEKLMEFAESQGLKERLLLKETSKSHNIVFHFECYIGNFLCQTHISIPPAYNSRALSCDCMWHNVTIHHQL